jgi:WXG100 family type VII secretion target
MNAEIIQAEYDQLDNIASRFTGNAEAIADMHRRVENAMQALQNGGWEGEGATAFFAEMDETLFPAMMRLNQSLEQAQSVTLQVKGILQAAEEDAAWPFKSNSDDVNIIQATEVINVSDGASTNQSDVVIPEHIKNDPYYDDDFIREPHPGEGQKHYTWELELQVFTARLQAEYEQMPFYMKPYVWVFNRLMLHFWLEANPRPEFSS